MSIQVTIDKLRAMKLLGLAQAVEEQMSNADCREMPFAERLALGVDREDTYRKNRQYQTRIRLAKLKEPTARIEDLDFKTQRGLEKNVVLGLAGCDWIRSKQNIFVIGPSGVGKTYAICALGQRACIEGFSVRYYRVPRLLAEVSIARAAGRYPQLLAYLAKVEVLILDDWGIAGLTAEERRDFLEIIEDRYGLRSTIVASQLPIDKWYGLIGDPTIADAILDRLIHSAHRITLRGLSQRKTRSSLTIEQPVT